MKRNIARAIAQPCSNRPPYHFSNRREASTGANYKPFQRAQPAAPLDAAYDPDEPTEQAARQRLLELCDRRNLHQARLALERYRQDVNKFSTFANRLRSTLAVPSWAPGLPPYVNTRLQTTRNWIIREQLPSQRNTLKNIDDHLKDLILEEYCRPGEKWRKGQRDGLKADHEIDLGRSLQQRQMILTEIEATEATEVNLLTKKVEVLASQVTQLAPFLEAGPLRTELEDLEKYGGTKLPRPRERGGRQRLPVEQISSVFQPRSWRDQREMEEAEDEPIETGEASSLDKASIAPSEHKPKSLIRRSATDSKTGWVSPTSGFGVETSTAQRAKEIASRPNGEAAAPLKDTEASKLPRSSSLLESQQKLRNMVRKER